jgi:glycerophosphoryl diester phosphodiesterase
MTLVVAHRGASAIAAENTLAAFEAAIAIGADMVEFDVRSTADGVLVVTHDPLPSSSYEELQPRPPRLEEVVEVCAGRIGLDVELKEPGVESVVLDLVSARLAPHAFVMTSFIDGVVAAAKSRRPDVRAGLLLGEETPLDAAEVLRRQEAASADFVAPHVSLLERGLAADGLSELVVWTVNDEALLRRYLDDARVSAVVTDDPERALAIRTELGA